MCQAVYQALCMDYLFKFPQQTCARGSHFFLHKDEKNKAKNPTASKKMSLELQLRPLSQCSRSV